MLLVVGKFDQALQGSNSYLVILGMQNLETALCSGFLGLHNLETPLCSGLVLVSRKYEIWLNVRARNVQKKTRGYMSHVLILLESLLFPRKTHAMNN